MNDPFRVNTANHIVLMLLTGRLICQQRGKETSLKL